MAKVKQRPTKIRTQQLQEQQQQNQQQNPQQQQQQQQPPSKSKAKSKSNPVAIMKLSNQQPNHNPNPNPNVMTVLRAHPTTLTKPLVSPTKKRKPKKQQQQQQQPIRRSHLMANALLPLMPSAKKKKCDEGQQKVDGSAGRRKVSGNATQTLLVIRDSLERLVNPKKTSPKSSLRRNPETTAAVSVKLEKVSHQPVSVETFYDKGQRVGSNRLAPMPLKQSQKLHLSTAAGAGGASGGGGASGLSSGGQSTVHTVGAKQNQKSNEMEVPLTTRLPIIDFISTDDFARMHATKKQKAARRLALANEANE
ncbi:mastermind-like protein 2 [Drosophila innubila]|uniref:mastermind-like protein 2 n=1 Tax=Drosophila innubila TaxID=198719 RepID=UPI00148BA45E|nr:mastermind-like protein 2 [Drosophila innubila]